MERDDYVKLTLLIKKQLSKYGIKLCDYDDYYQEVMIYLMNRHGEINVDAKYIYGDIKNGIINYLKKCGKNDTLLYDEEMDIEDGRDTSICEFELIDLLSDYEFGYLLIDKYIYDLGVTEMCEKYGLTKGKIYYEINKILSSIDWVN